MKFSEVKYANAFIARGLEIHAITPEQVEEVRECEIYVDGYSIKADNAMHVCSWTGSGIAGRMLLKIYNYDTSWRATDSPTPCQSCEALKARVKELEENTVHATLHLQIINQCTKHVERIHELEGILKAHGIETQTEVK